MVRKGLESCDFETLKLEHRCPSFDAGGDGHQKVTFRVGTIEVGCPHVNKNLSQLDLSRANQRPYALAGLPNCTEVSAWIKKRQDLI
jgi:hypothetical protein